MKIMTANRLVDGEVVWYGNGQWIETIDGAEIVVDPAEEARLEALGKQAMAANLILDLALIDIEVVDGAIRPKRLRERIRAAGPTIRNDLGKQARTQLSRAA
ncbi:DUF2849 domain-containing protein [Aquamicrobium terrae]|uniref:DUF2849 domain-containing protein n=1 Tax=Aquamicrobium terrae TaxID=1324945 RepID=A0ABV2N3B1_9HYPH